MTFLSEGSVPGIDVRLQTGVSSHKLGSKCGYCSLMWLVFVDYTLEYLAAHKSPRDCHCQWKICDDMSAFSWKHCRRISVGVLFVVNNVKKTHTSDIYQAHKIRLHKLCRERCHILLRYTRYIRKWVFSSATAVFPKTKSLVDSYWRHL